MTAFCPLHKGTNSCICGEVLANISEQSASEELMAQGYRKFLLVLAGTRLPGLATVTPSSAQLPIGFMTERPFN